MLTLDDQIKNILPPKYPATDEIIKEGEKRFREGFNCGVNKSHKAVKKAVREKVLFLGCPKEYEAGRFSVNAVNATEPAMATGQAL